LGKVTVAAYLSIPLWGGGAAGCYPGLQARLERFNSERENDKPLPYQVVTHHHCDHLGGIAEAVAAGARLVTVDVNIEAIKNGVTPPPENNGFLRVGPRTT
jgi:glyoxylase-like metal-dependent hydrolase (beta-lactamase superfamily II)